MPSTDLEDRIQTLSLWQTVHQVVPCTDAITLLRTRFGGNFVPPEGSTQAILC